MDFRQAMEAIKEHLPEYAAERLTKSSGSNYNCPFCGSGTGQHKTGAFSVKADGGKTFKCFSCGIIGDIIDLIQQVENISDRKQAMKYAADKYGINIEFDHKPTSSSSTIHTDRVYKTDTQNMHNSNTDSNSTQNIHNEHTHTNNTQTDSTNTQKSNSSGKTSKEENLVDYTEFYKEANKRLNETEYHRGISVATLNRFLIGYVSDWKPPKYPNAPTTPRLIIPNNKYGYLARDTRTDIPENQRQYAKRKTGKQAIFNQKIIGGSVNPLYIVEGEIDALSIIDVGAEAVGLGSTTMVKNFLNILSDRVNAKKIIQPLIIALDNDDVGKKAAAQLANGLKSLNLRYCTYRPYGEYKDANEALNADRKAFQGSVMYAVNNINELIEKEPDREQNEKRDEYINTNSAEKHLQEFLDGLATTDTEVIPTGFPLLDVALDGGLYEGLYGIGAISSLGKTTFILQIADQIAAAGNDVLIFSLEMARNELIAKSISRNTIKRVIEQKEEEGANKTEYAKTTRGIMVRKRYKNYNVHEHKLINNAIYDYAAYAKHIYIVEAMGTVGADQICEQVEKHIEYTGKKPVVIVDYLQILAPHNDKSTDKQNTDYSVMTLKRLSRDKKIPIIVISSFNRDNYSEKVSMRAFKESGAIEYSTDVLIGLQLKGTGSKDFDVDKAKAKDPREVELLVLKNRNGGTGANIEYKYYSMFNYFQEVNEEQIEEAAIQTAKTRSKKIRPIK